MSENKEKKLPLVYLEIDFDDMQSGVDAISFVDMPATEVEWKMFSKESKQMFEKNEVERILTGPVMLAETPIIRFSPFIGEYFIKFSEKTISQMMKKYFKENKIHKINEQHDSKRQVKDVYMVESFIVNERTQTKIFDVPNGSWMASFFVESKDYWDNTVMSGEFKGFSLEGMFSEVFEGELIEQVYSKIEKMLEHPDEEFVYDEIKRMLNLK